MSSSGEDSEAAEWEREQMLRGTQSRRNKYQQPRVERDVAAIDASLAKKRVMQDIKAVEANMETVKKSIGSTRLEMAKSEKKIESLKALIGTLSASYSFFKELGTLKESEEIAQFLDQNRALIVKLPSDQKEMIESLEQRVTVSSDTVEMEQD